VVNSVVADFNKEMQSLRASKAAKNGELQPRKAKAEAYKARVEALGLKSRCVWLWWPMVEPFNYLSL